MLILPENLLKALNDAVGPYRKYIDYAVYSELSLML